MHGPHSVITIPKGRTCGPRLMEMWHLLTRIGNPDIPNRMQLVAYRIAIVEILESPPQHGGSARAIRQRRSSAKASHSALLQLRLCLLHHRFQRNAKP